MPSCPSNSRSRCSRPGDTPRGSATTARWRTGEITPRSVAAPAWDGGALSGRTILVLPEQGLGDTLAFARFLPVLRDCGPARVALLAEKPLLRLMTGVEGAEWVGPGAPPGGFQAWANLMDLPGLHFAQHDAVPPPTRLTVPQDSRDRARCLAAPFRGRLRVGVVWAGSATYGGDAFRSFPHAALHALLDVPGVQLFSLYKGAGSRPSATTARAPSWWTQGARTATSRTARA